MNEREIAEIRRRMRPEKNNIGHIRGCYVNDKKSIISEFDNVFGLISNDESEEILSVFRRIFSGSIGRNLINISFSNQQVLDSEEHKLLSNLRSSSLSDTDSVKLLFEKIISSCDISESYMILLANDKYDIPKFDENDESKDSSEMFSYILCAVCPIKSAKPSLEYKIKEKKFKNVIRDSIVSAPEIGFMFPAFDSRSANIYNALFYTKDVSVSREGFTNAVFNANIPMPASEQTESIANILQNTIEDCSIDLVKAVQGQLIELAADHKTNKEEEPLLLSANDMGSLLRFGGVSEESINQFSERFNEDFGNSAAIPPANIIDIKKFEVKTPEVTVKVAPEYSDFVETRIIDGTKYLLIRADGYIEVNGIKINIED